MNTTRTLTVVSMAVLVALTGACSNNKSITTAGASAAEKQYEAKLKALEEREAALNSKAQQLTSRESDIATMPAPAAAPVAYSGDSLLPPNAKPGECYARIWQPPKFRTVTEKLLKKGEGERLEIIPASYEWTTERVLVSEASERLTPIPATYGTESERIQTRDAETFWTFGTSGPASARGGNAKRADSNRLSIARTAGVPESAQVGQCFAEYYTPAKFGTTTEKMLKSESTQKVVVTPAKYGTQTERVLVEEASEKLIQVPAQFKNETEKVLVKAPYTTWKVSECSGGACEPGVIANRVAGSRDRIDRATGEIMCLVEIPAQYKTVTKRVMVAPPATKRVVIPAKYKTVTRRVMTTPPGERIIETPATYQTVTKNVKTRDSSTYWCEVKGRSSASCSAGSGGRATGAAFCLNSTPAAYKTVTRRVLKTPASTSKIVIPEKYKTVKVRKLVTPASEKRIAIPASYQTVTRTEKVSEGHMQWSPVLCQVNMTRARIQDIQRALKKQGFYAGPIDGVVGSLTVSGMRKFQKAKGLIPTRVLTIETVQALGVNSK